MFGNKTMNTETIKEDRKV